MYIYIFKQGLISSNNKHSLKFKDGWHLNINPFEEINIISNENHAMNKSVYFTVLPWSRSYLIYYISENIHSCAFTNWK